MNSITSSLEKDKQKGTRCSFLLSKNFFFVSIFMFSCCCCWDYT